MRDQEKIYSILWGLIDRLALINEGYRCKKSDIKSLFPFLQVQKKFRLHFQVLHAINFLNRKIYVLLEALHVQPQHRDQ